MTAEQKWFFWHMPKTGGFSLFTALTKAFGADRCSGHLDASTPAEQLDAASAAIFAHGHLSDTLRRRHFERHAVLTVLREPVARCLSYYYFMRNNVDAAKHSGPHVAAAKALEIEPFFEALLAEPPWVDQFSNFYCRVLAGDDVRAASPAAAASLALYRLDMIAWIGFTETLEDDYARLRRIAPAFEGLPPLGRQNQTRNRPPQDAAPRRVRRIIEDLNGDDIAFYDWARARSRA